MFYSGWGDSRAIGLATSESTTVGVPISPQIPAEYQLYQSYPNPYNPSVTIQYDVPKEEYVRIVVFNTLGQQVATLINERRMPGRYSVTWNAQNVPSGAYWYRMTAGEFNETRKMVLLK